jgi:hypothetical protein
MGTKKQRAQKVLRDEVVTEFLKVMEDQKPKIRAPLFQPCGYKVNERTLKAVQTLAERAENKACFMRYAFEGKDEANFDFDSYEAKGAAELLASIEANLFAINCILEEALGETKWEDVKKTA